MQRPRCWAENREEARFCRECGATFSALCPNCGAKGGGRKCAGSVLAGEVTDDATQKQPGNRSAQAGLEATATPFTVLIVL
jgi:hypothetical protein